jgi:magnesium-protoporphyrin O-methyltransferase
MDRCGCDEFSDVFNEESAEQDRKRYRRNGPDASTAIILRLLRERGVAGATVLDIGGGIGVLDLELLGAGAGHATLVDAAGPALRVARQEASRTSVLDRLEVAQGDFVRLAPTIDRADIVTMDRVVCCYGDAASLMGRAAVRANRLLAVSMPRERLFLRFGLAILNLKHRLQRSAYRTYLHSNSWIDDLVAAEGLRPVAEDRTLVWRVVLYARAGAAA